MNKKKIELWLVNHGYPLYRLTQYEQAVKKGVNSWNEVSGWPQHLINQIALEIPFSSIIKHEVLESIDGTKKAKLTFADSRVIETVLMQPKPGIYSVCVSCEVGCPMTCAFCATGKMGLIRPLSSEEIIDQWRFWLSNVKQNTYGPSHLVFMGMGEPFHNQANVFAAIDVLHNEFKLGWRKISISTCGVIPGIQALSETYPQVNLAISLHAATELVRQTLMPVSKAYPLSQLQSALGTYMQKVKRQVMFEYLLLSEVNDREDDLSALIQWLNPLPKELVHVNLIRYNPTGTKFKQPAKKRVGYWKHSLMQAGISVSIRKNLGVDIFGACGQLATKN